MRIAADSKTVPAGSYRLLADVKALGGLYAEKRAPAQIRLEAALGRDFADRLVTALSEDRRGGTHGSPTSPLRSS